MIKANLHTHSLFCDGKDSLEENVLAAIEKKFDILGFSSHSLYPFWLECNMEPQKFEEYCAEVNRLKEAYKDKIKIMLGFEADYIPGVTFPTYKNYSKFKPDYLIGSVHFVYKKSGIFAIDESPESFKKALDEIYGGDIKKLVCDYFEAEKEMLQTGDFDIIGHCDLVRKFNEKYNFFDEESGWYKREVKALAKEIAKAGVIAEINTGGISRGWITSQYPSDYFLGCLNELKVPVIFSSDAHSRDTLDGSFDLAAASAKKAGYKEIMIPGTGYCDI
ncbi:MAG: histidinol-phosphatase [Treponema sp.]|nr:histidinol-phosphatase [Candidatus Treponema equifaecale]